MENSGTSFSAGSFSHWPEPLGLAALDDEQAIRGFADIARRDYRAVGIHAALHPEGRRGRALPVRARAGLPGRQARDPPAALPRGHHPRHGRDPALLRHACRSGSCSTRSRSSRSGSATTARSSPGLLRQELGYDGVVVTDWELVNDNHVVRLPRHGGLGAHRTRRTDLLNALLATIPADRVALVGLHAWSDDDYPHVAEWGLTAFGPEDLRSSSKPLLDWLAATGCSRVAIPFDVDRIDSNVIVLGLGAEPDGLTSEQVRRIVADVDHTVEVVGLTVAEFIPRHVLHLHQILHGFPLRGSPATSHPLPRG